jgi:hypothetical protein
MIADRHPEKQIAPDERAGNGLQICGCTKLLAQTQSGLWTSRPPALWAARLCRIILSSGQGRKEFRQSLLVVLPTANRPPIDRLAHLREARWRARPRGVHDPLPDGH